MQSGARQLRDWMRRRGYNQAETAETLGLTEAFLSMMMSGRRVPGRDKAVKIEDLTGIPVRAWSLTRGHTTTVELADNAGNCASNK